MLVMCIILRIVLLINSRTGEMLVNKAVKISSGFCVGKRLLRRIRAGYGSKTSIRSSMKKRNIVNVPEVK